MLSSRACITLCVVILQTRCEVTSQLHSGSLLFYTAEYSLISMNGFACRRIFSTLNQLSSFQTATPKRVCFRFSISYFLFLPRLFKKQLISRVGHSHTWTCDLHPFLLTSCAWECTAWHSAFIWSLLCNLSCLLMSRTSQWTDRLI